MDMVGSKNTQGVRHARLVGRPALIGDSISQLQTSLKTTISKMAASSRSPPTASPTQGRDGRSVCRAREPPFSVVPPKRGKPRNDPRVPSTFRRAHSRELSPAFGPLSVTPARVDAGFAGQEEVVRYSRRVSSVTRGGSRRRRLHAVPHLKPPALSRARSQIVARRA